jgi:multiple sugar transport system permease protein
MKKNLIQSVLIYSVLIVAVLLAVFPLYWVIATSLKLRVDVFKMPPVWFFEPTLDNFRLVLTSRFPGYFMNSLIISVGSLIVSLLIGVPTAYGLARLKTKKKKDIMFFILSTRMAPPAVFIIPFYILWSRLGLIDTHLALIVMYSLFTVSFVVWMMTSFFEEIPIEVEEAAWLDGCSRWGCFFKVSLPCVRGGLVAATILAILLSWNEFFYALILTAFDTKTMPVALPGYIGFVRMRWGELSAAATIVVIPVLVFALIVQKNIVRGLVGSAIEE